jgi:hypothetical protein
MAFVFSHLCFFRLLYLNQSRYVGGFRSLFMSNGNFCVPYSAQVLLWLGWASNCYNTSRHQRARVIQTTLRKKNELIEASIP